MAKIHFIGGEKGGVGKSVTARLLAQYMIDKELPFIGFDTDRSHAALLRFYRDYACEVLIDRYESLDTIIEMAVDEPERRVLVDLAAQTSRALEQWISDSGVSELAQDMGIGIQYWHVMDSGQDSVDLLMRLFDVYGSGLNYAVVLNQARSDRFDIFERSGARARAEELNATIMPLKRLHASAMAKIDASSTSFWAATHLAAEGSTGLSLLERQRVKIWLKHAYDAMSRVDI